MTDCWMVLGIEETTDLRVIKTAYAKKVRRTKPDEKPAEFQQLHQAYKLASITAQHQVNEKNIERPPTPDIDLPLVDSVQGSDQSFYVNISENLEQPAEAMPFETEISSAMAHVRDLLENEARAQRVSEWEFVGRLEHILDDTFRNALSERIFERLVRHESKSRRNRINSDVLNFLDQIFLWKNSAYFLAAKYQSASANNILGHLNGGRRYAPPKVIGGAALNKKIQQRPQRPSEESTLNLTGISGIVYKVIFAIIILSVLRRIFS